VAVFSSFVLLYLAQTAYVRKGSFRILVLPPSRRKFAIIVFLRECGAAARALFFFFFSIKSDGAWPWQVRLPGQNLGDGNPSIFRVPFLPLIETFLCGSGRPFSLFPETRDDDTIPANGILTLRALSSPLQLLFQGIGSPPFPDSEGESLIPFFLAVRPRIRHGVRVYW